MLGARLARAGRPAATGRRTSLRLRERIEQALDPLSKAIPLSPVDVSRTRAWLIQAGYRDAIDVNYYFGARLLMAAHRLCRRRAIFRLR